MSTSSLWNSLLFVASFVSQTWSADQPNIVFIMVDDLGFNDVGYHGSDIVTTNIDRLAREGVRLESFYTQPRCTPSRSELLVGRHAIYTGLQHRIISPAQDNYPPLELPTVADKLKSVGYSTHLVGKWHLGFSTRRAIPTYRGFDTFYGLYAGAVKYYNHSIFDHLSAPRPDYKNALCGLDLHDDKGEDLKADWSQRGRYITDVFTEKAVQRIYEHSYSDADKPMFLMVSYNAPHSPIQAPEWRKEKYEEIFKDPRRQTFAGMVDAIDEGVGNITRALEQTGLMDNTIIIFTTDNGGDRYFGGSNLPLKGEKGTLFEGAIRCVAFVNSPLLKETGYINSEMIEMLDWYPTLVNLGGASTSGQKLDGYDVWETISERKESLRTEFLISIDPFSLPVGTNLYPEIFDTRMYAGIRRGDWKLITGGPDGVPAWPPPTIPPDPSTQNIRLYNIKIDPTEEDEVSGDHPDIVMDLMWRLAMYNNSAVPVRYPALDHRADPKLSANVWMPWIDERLPYKSFFDPSPALQYQPECPT